jgi:predicted AAA+ superfamily ATPase
VLQRDVIDLARVEGLTRLPDLLRLLAARGGSLLNVAELSRSAQLPRTTLDRYLALLEGTFLIRRLPAWSPNLGKRLVRSPKVFIEDPGLAAHLLGLERVDEMSPASVRGPLLESFVRAEVEALASWSRTRPRVHHFRSHTGIEVDLVLEDARGRCVAIETKATATVGPRDFKGLRWLAEHLGDRFVRGVLLYTGRTTVPAGERSAALPVEALWRVASE